jgi:hypothetical protein
MGHTLFLVEPDHEAVAKLPVWEASVAVEEPPAGKEAAAAKGKGKEMLGTL